jgi:hypothetical protein
MKKLFPLLLIILLLSSCANVESVDACLQGRTYGFFGGLLHGIIAPFSFIGSLFKDDIAVYATNNNGGWYDFGFLLGIGGLGFGSSKSTSKITYT